MSKTLMQITEEFHSAGGHAFGRMGWTPQALELVKKLVQEEAAELVVEINRIITHLYSRSSEPLPVEMKAKFAKELADLVLVCGAGAFHAGFNADDALTAVHENNMAKAGPDGKFALREDGKILKPEGHQPPDLTGLFKPNKEW